MTDTTIERAVETITTADAPGLAGGGSSDVNARVQAAVAARTARLRAFLAVVTPAPITGKVWVPDLAAATGGGAQPAEKAELPTTLLHITGASETPALVGGAWNVAWQVMQAAGGAIEALLTELALRRMVDYVLAQLQGDALVATDFADAAAQVEAAGYPVDVAVGSTSALLAEDIAGLDIIGVRMFGGLPINGVLVGSLAGTFGASSAVMLRTTEPAIAGYEVSAFGEVVVKAAPGSMAFVASV